MSQFPASVPLFGPIPGGAELLVVGLLTLVVPLGLALWVGLDAREHSDHPLAWGLTVLVAGFSPFFVGSVAVTLLYFISREELGSYAPPTFGEADLPDDAQVLGRSLGEQRAERATAADADQTAAGGDVDGTAATDDDRSESDRPGGPR